MATRKKAAGRRKPSTVDQSGVDYSKVSWEQPHRPANVLEGPKTCVGSPVDGRCVEPTKNGACGYTGTPKA